MFGSADQSAAAGIVMDIIDLLFANLSFWIASGWQFGCQRRR